MGTYFQYTSISFINVTGTKVKTSTELVMPSTMTAAIEDGVGCIIMVIS